MKDKRWRIRLGDEAEKDFARILKYTEETFGERQLEIYKLTLLDALSAFDAGPNVPGSAAREDIFPGLRSLHIARKGRRGRHFILYRAAGNDVIEIIRILHDQMDMARHIPQTLN